MLTLSYGVKKPQTGDTGSVVFPALEDNAQQQNDHTHNGVNSAKLVSSSITLTTATVLAASWVALGSGNFRQLVTMPGSLLFDDYRIEFKDNSTGHQLYLSVEKVSATTYYVYINDSSITLKALYIS